MANPLLELSRLGQSVWYDNVRRGLITSGEFQRMVAGDGVAGVTSNPTIFEKAVNGGTDYDADIAALVAPGKDVREIYDALTVRDIQMAADVLRPVYDRTEGLDGYACLEVSPKLAYDTEASIDAARRLFRALDRPNVMIKIPGTPQGLPAIEQCLSEGININITLLFSVENYEQVAWAYVSALEKLAAAGRPLDRLASVASFFVSRVDTLVDAKLEELARKAGSGAERDRLESLRGKAAIANAKIAYAKFKEVFSGPRWGALAAKGARVQRCLWASTGTKDPRYRDVMYVEDLIGPQTVNTMPQATLDAFRDHGRAATTLEEGLAEVQETMRLLADAGIDYREVTEELQTQGVKLFADSYDKLLASIDEKREALLAAKARRVTASLGEHEARVARTLRSLTEGEFSRRLWAKDASLWKDDPAQQRAIRQRLGWLTVTEAMSEHSGRLAALGEEVKAAGFSHAVLLGMGGSSLAAEVLRRSIGHARDNPDLTLLDTTVPASILEVEHMLDLERTLFIVSSKSGTTVETVSLFRYFFEKVRAKAGARAGEQFIAITDPGTPLAATARSEGFRHCFLNPPDVGGRYSVLSYFGLVPAAVMGIDAARLLDRAESLLQGCASCVPADSNPGVLLGTVLGALALAGRDKVTFLAPPALAPFGAWAEQMLAESTGKEGKGLIPVDGEPAGEPSVYGDDRLFVRLRLEGERDGLEEVVRALEAAGQPVVTTALRDRYDLGQEFFRWEMATAVAGALLGINPFDEPNVQESKENTARLLRELEATGRLPEGTPFLEEGGLSLYCDEATATQLRREARDSRLAALLGAHLGRARPGDYVALLAYLPRRREHEESLSRVRAAVRDATRLATTLGFGPRYLHSTGQLHKGGPDRAVFLQLTADDQAELPIPGQRYGFGTLKRAQALGDLQALQSPDSSGRVLRVHLGADVSAGLRAFEEAIGKALTAAARKGG